MAAMSAASPFFLEMWSPAAFLLKDATLSVEQLMDETEQECALLGGHLEDSDKDSEDDEPGQSIFALWPGHDDRGTTIRALFCNNGATDIIVDITRWQGDAVRGYGLRKRLEEFIIHISGGSVEPLKEHFPYLFPEKVRDGLPRVLTH